MSGDRAGQRRSCALIVAMAMAALSTVTTVARADGPGIATTWRSNGNGTFALDFFNPWAGYHHPNGIWLVADINGDGKKDIIHVAQSSGVVHPWISNGNGTFTVKKFSPWAGYAIPNGQWLVADINGDGKDDIVHAVHNSNYVHPWISNGNGTFTVKKFSPWSGYAIPNGLWMVADINGDNKDDIVHAVKGTSYVHPWISNGNGTFTVKKFSPRPPRCSRTTQSRHRVDAKDENHEDNLDSHSDPWPGRARGQRVHGLFATAPQARRSRRGQARARLRAQGARASCLVQGGHQARPPRCPARAGQAARRRPGSRDLAQRRGGPGHARRQRRGP